MPTLFNKDNFVSARYSTPNNTEVEVIFKLGDQLHATIVQVDYDQEEFKTLLNITTADKIAENTSKWVVEQRRALINFHQELINKKVVQMPHNEYAVLADETLAKILSFDPEDNLHEDFLVNLKITVLENESLQLTTTKKKNIRGATTPIDVFKQL